MMNKIKFSTSLILLAPFFTSCNSDDEDVKSPGISSSIDSELAPFIGYWVNDAGDTWNMLLLEDGTCLSTIPTSGNGQIYEGVWNYDPQTKYFVNTALKKNYLITFCDGKHMMGINPEDYNRSISYTKNDYHGDLMELVLNGTWISTDKSITQPFKFNYYDGSFSCHNKPELPRDNGRMRYKSTYMFCNGSTNYFTYTIRYWVDEWWGYPDNKWFENTTDSGYRGEIYVENPYNPKKTKITLTGVIEGTYIKDTTQD